MRIALRIVVTGLVQGVGFRPFVHRAARKAGVAGYVRNVGGSEVEIRVEGEPPAVSRFLELLYTEKPPPAVIEELEIEPVAPHGLRGFRILPSSRSMVKRSMIPPDFAICPYCLREVLDPKDRRYRYPFNSCAWCGPRFSMMYRAPYDRENTSMRKYPLCDECRREYEDPDNIRRYHAQGISCPRDGPRLWLATRDGERVEAKDPIREAARLIDEGFIVAVKGLGGYHLAALASDDDVVATLRRRKRRPTKPFAVMALDTEVARRLVYLSREAEEVLELPQHPILLLPKREDSPVSPLVSPGMDVEGVFLPYTALHYLLLMETRDKFLIMTSGNVHGKPMCIDERCAFTHLSMIADYFLVHDREIVNRVDDSVLRYTHGRLVMLRRGRGYAPAWIRLPAKLGRDVVAFGAELQTAGAVAFEDKAVLTQFIGDVDDVDTLGELERYLRFFIENYRIDLSRAVLVVDKHPGYASRRLAHFMAEEHGGTILEVQHHYAHLLATAVDTGALGRSFVGIAIDGVGYGDDGAVWGGEVMLVSSDGEYERVGHLRYAPLVGDASTVYPARFALSLLAEALGSVEEALALAKRLGLGSRVRGGDAELELVARGIEAGLYTPTSSTGRFLDAVSALLGVAWVRSYEGEPAIRLEAYARRGRVFDNPGVRVRRANGVYVADTPGFFLYLAQLVDERDRRDIARTAQVELGRALGRIAAEAARGRRVCREVMLGGGAAVNDYIVEGIEQELREAGMELVLPRRVPPNDGGIALGQVGAALLAMSSGRV